MRACVALLRGINVGGHNKLPMQDLRNILASLGCKDVKTYIQSGNAVFRTASIVGNFDDEIAAAIENSFGFRPGVLILDIKQFKAIAAANPYGAAENTPAHVHVLFLAERPRNPDLEGLYQLKSGTESFELTDAAFYLHAPDGIGRSKLSARAEKALGVAGTGRNWRTVSKILELADSIIS